MAETFSIDQSSLGLSKKLGTTTTNYNLLSNIPRALILQIKNDGTQFKQRAVCFSMELWKTMRKRDFTSNRQLSIKLIESIYEKHKEDIIELFSINSPNQFLNIFDSDNDGLLNEDEQILVFSTLKERMQHTANSLLKIQEYTEFKLLMKELREVEALIAGYQDELRSKIYKNELKQANILNLLQTKQIFETIGYYNNNSLEKEGNFQISFGVEVKSLKSVSKIFIKQLNFIQNFENKKETKFNAINFSAILFQQCFYFLSRV